ncbi:MAG: type VI secretion system protein TssA [Phycisphaeraceae bacterium]|nr:type VI secretion system protein TssA [Phycisphaeraceae bacterium]
MSVLDLETLLAPVSEDNPAGESLEYDTAYTELFRASEGSAERQMGDSVIAAEEPNWREIADGALALAPRTRDLRLSVLLTLALLKTKGVKGLSAGLAYTHGLLDRGWDWIYPKLDPDDGNDPTERVMILDSFTKAPGSFGDPMRLQERVRDLPLTNSRQLGRLSFRDVLVARGEIEAAPDQPTVDSAIIKGAFEDTPLEELQETHAELAKATDLIKSIDQLVTEKAGASKAISLSAFTNLLKQVTACVGEHLANITGADVAGAEGDAGGGGGGGGRGGAPLTGDIRSTQDVVMALDKICRYYESHEPSSPVPILLRRAQRLVSKSFLDIMMDLTPDAMHQIRMIGGITEGS